MAIGRAIAQFGANFIALMHTRVALATVELEEEALRYFSYLLMALAAMFFMALAFLLLVLLLVALFWDQHRIAVLLALIALFAGAGVLLGLNIRDRFRRKPHLLGHTLIELARDVEALKPVPGS